jgi:hypothetical protein
LKLEDAWIEISPSQANTSWDKDLFVVFRKIIGPHLSTWIGLYRSAREIGYDRPGSFYGAGAWIIEDTVDVKLITEVLHLMASQVQAKAMNGDRFIKRISDIRSEITPPEQLSNLRKSLSKATAGCHPSGEVGFIVDGKNPLEIIDWAQKAHSANTFSKIFIGSHDQISEHAGSSSITTYRSLAIAIESSYHKRATEFQNLRSDMLLKIKQDEKTISDLQQENNHLDQLLASAKSDVNKYRHLSSVSEASAKAEKAHAESLRRQINERLFMSGVTKNPHKSSPPKSEGTSDGEIKGQRTHNSSANEKLIPPNSSVPIDTFVKDGLGNKSKLASIIDFLLPIFVALMFVLALNFFFCRFAEFGISCKNFQVGTTTPIDQSPLISSPPPPLPPPPVSFRPSGTY